MNECIESGVKARHLLLFSFLFLLCYVPKPAQFPPSRAKSPSALAAFREGGYVRYDFVQQWRLTFTFYHQIHDTAKEKVQSTKGSAKFRQQQPQQFLKCTGK